MSLFIIGTSYMPTKTGHRWKEKPGGYDTVGTEHHLYSDNTWGIPLVRRSPKVILEPPEFLIDYKNARILGSKSKQLEKAGIHFFIDDYRFELLWNMRIKTLTPVQKFHTVFTPDFSLYTDWPKAVNVWNTYRNRLLGALWQENGVERVVPTIGWSDESSYEYAFLGVEKGSPVAVATLGLDEKDTYGWGTFRQGYEEMVRIIEPDIVFCYGPLQNWVYSLTPVRCYPTKWDLLHPNKRMRDNVYNLPKQVKAQGSFMPVPVELAQGEKMLYNQDSDRVHRQEAVKRKLASQGWSQTSLRLFEDVPVAVE